MATVGRYLIGYWLSEQYGPIPARWLLDGRYDRFGLAGADSVPVGLDLVEIRNCESTSSL